MGNLSDRQDLADPHAILRTLRRRAGIIIMCAILVPAAAVAFSVSQQNEYTASASLLFRDPQFDQKLFGSTAFQPSVDPAREAATNVKLVALEIVAARTANALHGRVTAAQVQAAVAVEPEGQSDVASIRATTTDPRFAATLANTFAQQFILFRREADRSKIASADELVQAQLDRLPAADRAGDRGRTLRNHAEQLKVLAALQTGNAELVQPARPPTVRSSPKPLRNGIIGGFLGLILGAGLAFLLERFDRRLRTTREIGDAFGRPILGTVPQSRGIAREGVRALDAGEQESFRMLRANLRYFNVDSKISSVLITSAAPAEGKSTVAMYLALTAAAGGAHVLLLEADMRKPTLAQRLGISSRDGLSQVLAGARDLGDVVKHVRLNTGANDTRSVDVLPTGPIPPNPTDLVESDRMRRILRGAEAAYDLVIIDTPPTSIVSDAIPLVNEVSGVIVVSRLGRTTRESAAHLRKQLEQLGANTLGIVVNSVGRRGSGYGYYGYSDRSGYTKDPDTGVRRRRKRQVVTVAGAVDQESDVAEQFAEASRDPVASTNGHENGNGRDSANGAASPESDQPGHYPVMDPPVSGVRHDHGESFSHRMRRRLGG
jgi:capsular exopolysaccharide synthesis family protein